MTDFAIQKSAALRDQVIEGVLELLNAGVLVPGQRVTEEGLVKQLSVSRTPIREALGQLVHRGVLQARPGGGYVVPLPTEQAIRETIFVRMLLEPAALRLAAIHFGPDEIEAINRAILGETDASSEESPLRFAQANEDFRSAIFSAIPNQALRGAISQFNSHLHFIRSSTLNDLSLRKQIVDRQAAIRNAIAAHDPDIAEGLWRSYLRLAEEALTGALRHFLGGASEHADTFEPAELEASAYPSVRQKVSRSRRAGKAHA